MTATAARRTGAVVPSTRGLDYNEAVQALERSLAELGPIRGSSRILLFGSRARGEETEDSDYDLFVLSPEFEGQALAERAVPYYRALRGPEAFDILCLTPAEFADLSARPTSWVSVAAREAIEVYPRPAPVVPRRRSVRPEAEQWLKVAQADARLAESIAQGGAHPYGAVFFAQQAAEKALKALWHETQSVPPPKTHELRALADRLGAPASVVAAASELAPEFVLTRYPIESVGSPLDAYSPQRVTRLLGLGREILEWVEGRMTSAGPAPD